MTRQPCEQCGSGKGVAWDHEWQGYLCFACTQELTDVVQDEASGRTLLDDQDLAEQLGYWEPALHSR
jgi:hypothetical protein